MVGGIHGRVGGISVPEFPDGGGTFLCHVSPTRVGVVRSNLPGHIYPAVFGEAAHQMLDAQDTGTDMAAEVSLRFLDNVGKHFFFISFWNES